MPFDPDLRQQFDEFLEEILDGLPADVAQLLEEIPLVVDDEPSDEILESLGIDPNEEEPDVCGLHTGVPLSERSVFETPLVPDVIRLFRGPILRLADGSAKRLRREIRITLLHELGHHFGLTEERLKELGYD